MDPSIITGLSAVFGSLVGGAASIATAWFTQKAQSHREAVQAEVTKREMIYGEFIAECSKLLIDSLDKTLDNPAVLIQVYGLINRIRLSSSAAVMRAAEKSIEAIVEQYFSPKISLAELRKTSKGQPDPLQGFSEACRIELRELTRST